MAKKLEGNGLWETRIILPEHRKQYMQQKENDARELIQRPALDETQLDAISQRIRDSIDNGTRIEFKVWGRLNPVSGVVSMIDVSARRVKIGGEWVKLDDIVG